MKMSWSRALAVLSLGVVLTLPTGASATTHSSGSHRHAKRAHSQAPPHHGVHSQSHGARHGRTHNHTQRPRHRGSRHPR